MWFSTNFQTGSSSCTRGLSTHPRRCSGSAFPDGQFVVLDGDRSVGAPTTLRLH
jgi:hypothetical protein